MSGSRGYDDSGGSGDIFGHHSENLAQHSYILTLNLGPVIKLVVVVVALFVVMWH